MHTKADSELFYYRTSNGAEIDLIVDRKTRREYIEIKSGETYRSEMGRTIERFKASDEEGIVLYRGRRARSTPGMRVINYKEYLEAAPRASS
jgi:predicted AAA+ superfamily ATPase